MAIGCPDQASPLSDSTNLVCFIHVTSFLRVVFSVPSSPFFSISSYCVSCRKRLLAHSVFLFLLSQERRMGDKLSNRPTSIAGESGSRSTATTSDEVKGEEEEKKDPRGLSLGSFSQSPHFTAGGHSLHPEASRHFNKEVHWC